LRPTGVSGSSNIVAGRKAEPELIVSAGQVERWRLVNASSARYVRLSIGGAPSRIMGTGGGLVEASVIATEALLVPGDRLDIAVGPLDEETTYSVESLTYDRGVGAQPSEVFATVRVGSLAASHAVIPDRLRMIGPLVNVSGHGEGNEQWDGIADQRTREGQQTVRLLIDSSGFRVGESCATPIRVVSA